jgi:hypothetical protein
MIHCTLFHDSDPFYSFDLEGSTFFLGIEVENVFQSLKPSFTILPLLIHVEPSKPFVLEMDTFDFALGATFSQLEEDIFFIQLVSILVSFLLPRLTTRFKDKEFLAIMNAFEESHHLLERVQHEIIAYFDHKNPQYFMTTYVLK